MLLISDLISILSYTLLNTRTKINPPLSNLITVSANNYTRNLDSFCIFLFNLHKSFTQRKKTQQLCTNSKSSFTRSGVGKDRRVESNASKITLTYRNSKS